MIRNDQEYAEVLRQLQELFAEREREAELRRLLGQDDEDKGVSISAAAERPEKKRNRRIGRGIAKPEYEVGRRAGGTGLHVYGWEKWDPKREAVW